MRCPRCRTLILISASEAQDGVSLMRCSRCPAVWLLRAESGRPNEAPPAMIPRSPLIIEGSVLPVSGTTPGAYPLVAVPPRFNVGRYGIAAGAAILILALVAVVLLAPDVSALPGMALLEGGR